MALATVELLCTIPLSGYGLYLNLTAAPMNPWISWEDTHFDYSHVNQYPAVIWRMSYNSVVSFELSRWAAPFCAFVFFGFFGFAEEARKNYVVVFSLIRRFPLSVIKQGNTVRSVSVPLLHVPALKPSIGSVLMQCFLRKVGSETNFRLTPRDPPYRA